MKPAFALALLIAAAAHATTLVELETLIRQRHLNTIDAVLAALPERERTDYALVFESRSLHGASFQNPRVILFSETSRLFITFNGAPDQKAFDALEVAEFDDATDTFTYVELRFPGDRGEPGAPTFSQPNPETCRACHGTPARPLWDAHPLWPGAVGERYQARLSAVEQAGVSAFLAAQPTHPRYRWLLDAPRFSRPETFVPDPASRYAGAVRRSPNEALAHRLGALNARRLARQVREAPHFEALRATLLFSLCRACGPLAALEHDPGYDAFVATTAHDNALQTRNRLARAWSLRGEPPTLPPPVVTLTAFRYVVERGLGVSTRSWAMALEAGAADFTAPTDFQVELERELLKSEPGLASLRVAAPERYCARLRSLGAQAWEPPPVAAHAPAPTPLPALLALCMSCHTGAVGPALPFDDAQALAPLLSEPRPSGRTLLDELRYRLSDAAGAARMPRGMNLVPEEQAALLAWFERASR